MQLENIESVEIPESHISFANEVAVLAEKNGISRFTLEYEPRWNRDGGDEWDRRARGKAKIHYSDKDERGRPCRKLGISFDASFTHIIETNPESSN